MDYYFYRFEVTYHSACALGDVAEKVVVIVDSNETRARMRLRQMHPKAVVLNVDRKPFVIPDHRKVPGGAHRNPAAHKSSRST